MNRTIRSLSLLALVAGAVFVQAQDAVTLRRVYTAGATDVYTYKTTSESNTDMSNMGQDSMSMKMGTTMDIAISTKSVDKDGNALLELLATNVDMKMDATGAMAEMMKADDMPKTLKATAKGNPFMQLSELKMLGEKSAGMAMMSGGLNPLDLANEIAFPKDAIKIGDSFEVAAKEGGLYVKGTKFTGKLLSEGELNGLKVWNLEYSGKPSTIMDLGKAMAEGGGGGAPEGMNIMVETKTEMKSKISIEKETGRLVSYSSTFSSDGAVKLPDMGIEFPTTAAGVVELKLKK
jgi:hypothetical protein